MRKKLITIVDYGLSNIFSIRNAIESLGYKTKITSKSQTIDKAEVLVLPGVGSFPAAIKRINKLKIKKSIKNFIASGKPFLGICLGFQLLFQKSYEFGNSKGLGILKGEVKIFSKKKINKSKLHIGWNKLKLNKKFKIHNKKLIYQLKNNFYYFVHSYHVIPKDKNIVSFTSNFKGEHFCSGILKNNIFALQFHPEKSGIQGLKMLKIFLKNEIQKK